MWVVWGYLGGVFGVCVGCVLNWRVSSVEFYDVVYVGCVAWGEVFLSEVEEEWVGVGWCFLSW